MTEKQHVSQATPDKARLRRPRSTRETVLWVVTGAILLGLLGLGLYGVHEFKQGRFAWMAHDETRFFNKLRMRGNAPAVQDEVIQRMVPIHDNEPSRISEFSSELEQDCYLAFAGSVCGYTREAGRAQKLVEVYVNQAGMANPTPEVQACALGTQRFREEMRTLRAGQPHCATVRDIVKTIVTP